MRDTVWLYYQWGTYRSLAEPVDGDLLCAQRVLQDLIDLYDDVPTNGTWFCGPKARL